MSYRCGIDEPLASVMGVTPGGPRIWCDGCGIVFSIRTDRVPPSWFLDGKAPPRWRIERGDDGTRKDWCPMCKIDRLLDHPANHSHTKASR